MFGTLRGSISAEAARRNDRLEFAEVQFADRAQRLGGRTILKAVGQTIEPGCILGLRVDETGDVVVPSSGSAAMVGGVACANHRGTRRTRGAIPGLALGVGHRGYADRFAWHDFHSEALRHETPGAQARFLKRQLSLPVSTISQWWVSSIEERGRHLRIAEHARPFAKGEVGGHDD